MKAMDDGNPVTKNQALHSPGGVADKLTTPAPAGGCQLSTTT